MQNQIVQKAVGKLICSKTCTRKGTSQCERHACCSANIAELLPAPTQVERLDTLHESPTPTKTLHLNPTDFSGGIAVWGAFAPAYNTSQAQDEVGVHVHARTKVGGVKSIDATFSSVMMELPSSDGGVSVFTANGDDAARYNIARIFGIPLSYMTCPQCLSVHSDHNFGLVHPHQNHECEVCGFHWTTDQPCVSNPMVAFKKLCGNELLNRPQATLNPNALICDQRDFTGGIQIWGTHPAILWTFLKSEEEGLHVHTFVKGSRAVDIDETYGVVVLDGIELNRQHVRYFMAQKSLPFLAGCIVSLECPTCHAPHFDRDGEAVTPHHVHTCENCGHRFHSPNGEMTVSNPAKLCFDKLKPIAFSEEG